MLRSVLALLVLVACLQAPAPTRAFHNESMRPVVNTAFTLRRRGARLGVNQQAVGVGYRLQVSTALLGWTAALHFDTLMPNGTLKLGSINLHPLYLAVESGVVSVVPREEALQAVTTDVVPGDGAAGYTLIPVAGYLTYALDSALFSLDARYFFGKVSARGQVVDNEFDAVISGEMLIVGSSNQYSLDPFNALTLTFRTVPYVPKTPLRISAELDGSKIDINGWVRVADVQGAWQIVPGYALSTRVFNLRVGLGYGNIMVPTLGLVVSRRGPVAEFDMYLRF